MTTLFMSQLIDKYIETSELEAKYDTISMNISQKILALNDFPNPPSKDNVRSFLNHHLSFKLVFSLINCEPVSLKNVKLEMN